MTRTDSSADPLAELAFEIERFEWVGDDRLEVVGRWFGVRGRRFIRPTLHARAGGRRRRMIAVLDHKPWSPEEKPWTAAFAWRGEHDRITSVRLEVAPDVVLDLPAPGAAAAGTTLNPRPKPRREPAPKRATKPKAPPAALAVDEPRDETPPPTEPAAAAPTAEVPPDETPPPTMPDVATLALQRRLAEEQAAREAAAAERDEERAAREGLAAELADERAARAGLAAELAEERAAGELLAAELAQAREQNAALAAHQASAVERAQDVVQLEGELAAARRQLAAAGSSPDLERELAATREELAEARTPIEVAPLERRLPIRRRSDWAGGTRVAVVAALVVLFVLFALVVLWVL